MKLIQRTYRLTLLWLLPVLAVGSVFIFYMISYVIYEETDEFLTYEMNRLVKYHKQFNDLPEFHSVAGIQEGVLYDIPVFKDTLLLETGDNEMVPYRELYFTIVHKGQNFTIVLRHLLVGRDDILEGSLFILVGLMLLISITLFFMVNQVSKNVWTPFYKTLKTLTGFKINEPLPAFPETGIDEFNTLNTTAARLLKKITADYKRTKEFNENASHELQTHLAIIRANAEILMNGQNSQNIDEKTLQTIYNATVKLSRAQKSLLLLSKIGNQEYNNQISLNLAETLKQTLSLFHEAIEIRGITVTENIDNCNLQLDAGLAEILVNNLVKNAIKHNIQNGYIVLHLEPSSLTIENSGLYYEEEPENLLTRFKTGTNGNMGIGLAIVKQICELYDYTISYKITKEKSHILQISFSKA